ncbi:MAG: hypothetical protein E7660_05095 [Ruminococcaceae bacterium]|nr:hypothetical protein [Oscillospiraceae bacterium]
MKKRIISALLAILMLVSCFGLTGCNQDKEETTEEEAADLIGQRVSMTLTMWLPAAEGTKVDDESVAQVEKAINEITQAKFSTAIKFKVFESDAYDKAVEDQLAECKRRVEQAEEEAAKKREEEREAAAKGEKPAENAPADTTAVADTKPVEKENEFAAMNAALFASYPAVEPAQFDIFVVRGADNFVKYRDGYMLAPLTENLGDDSKILYSYIYPTFFQSAMYQGDIYAVPNNHGVGKYEIMLVNKRIAEALYYDVKELNSVQKFFTYDNSGISFIEDAMANYPDVTPVAGTYTAPYVKYWNSKDDGKFSILSSLVGGGANSLADVTVGSTLKNANYVNYVTYSKRLSEIAAPAKFDPDKECIVGFTTATAEEIAAYSEKYEVTVLQNPQPTQVEALENSFAVSVYSKNVDRSMEIITLLNTDEELRSILQYGVEGIHWKKDVDDNSIMHVISDKYKMDINETGNVYMTYPADGVPMSAWDYAKQQNLDSVYSITSGFNYTDPALYEKLGPVLEELDGYSKDIGARIEAMTYAEFTSNLEALRKEIDDLKCFQKLTYMPTDDEETLAFDVDESLAFAWFNFINEE